MRALLFAVATLGLFSLFAAHAVAADQAPAWELKDLNGKSVQLSQFRGKVVILDFWATWCPPCREEIPNFIDLQKQYGDQGLQVIGISLDQVKPPEVASFVKAQGINYPIVMGSEAVASQYGDIQAIPTTFVIDQKGNIVDRHEGFTDKDAFEKEIKSLLPAPAGK